jgi:hypothetical protein
MGWISKRYMQTGHSLGAGSKTGKRAGILRKIVGTVEHNNITYELLECGHRGYPVEIVGIDLFGPQHANSRRCMECRKKKDEEGNETSHKKK